MTPKLKDLVGGDHRVRFVRFQSGELWYEHVGTGFQFPVPVSDTGDAAFCAEDRAVYFMRWIRKHLAFLESAKEAAV